MQIQSICNNINRSNFKGKFEPSPELERLTQNAVEKDLMEFSLMLDVINNAKDDKVFFVREKKSSALNPDKGFILWCHEHWDSFPKPYKSCIVDNFENKKQIAPILGNFTDLLKSIYKVDFDKDIKSHFQKQIISKLRK